MSEKFKEFMEKDVDFSEKIIGFVSERHTKKEKESFFREITTYLVTNGNVKEAYAKMYPDEYTLR